MVLGFVIAIALAVTPPAGRSAEDAAGVTAWETGMSFLVGDGVAEDHAEAVQHFRRSAEHGYHQGQISLAVMLATGDGVAEDDAQARSWYEKAANQGSAHALRGLGGMLILGEGGEVDLAKGLAYVELAAEGGDEIAPRLIRDFAIEAEPEGRAEVDAIKADWLAKHGKPWLDD